MSRLHFEKTRFRRHIAFIAVIAVKIVLSAGIVVKAIGFAGIKGQAAGSLVAQWSGNAALGRDGVVVAVLRVQRGQVVQAAAGVLRVRSGR
jgi:hypothetical protein